MGLRIYNTLTGQKEDFKPLNPPEVKMYVCGPTVYDEPHIGHLRSAYVFEVMRRWMEHSGYKVQFVRNVTDVDDKIIDKARQENAADLKSATTVVSSKYFDLYKKDLAALGIQEPTVEPRATTHIPQMLDLIGQLIQKGFAYHVPGTSDVYFEVKKFAAYGKLSKQKIDEMMDQARKESAPGKRDPLDFALWKGAKPDEPAWQSPWGLGRPGWHIECSAMNLACLGEQIDIHGGGLDLKFPHHENEIAQSESATGKPFAKYWVHHGLVTVEAQKMSKSQKNFISLEKLLISSARLHGIRGLKFLFLSAQYSSPLDFSDSAMAEAFNQSERFVNFFRESKKHRGEAEQGEFISLWEARFSEAMNDNFNTPKSLAVMHELVAEARRKNSPGFFVAASTLLEKWGMVLGGVFESMNFMTHLRDSADGAVKVELYKEARRRKDYKVSDLLRKELAALGITVRDLPGGEVDWTLNE